MKKELSYVLANIRLLGPGMQVAAGQPHVGGHTRDTVPGGMALSQVWSDPGHLHKILAPSALSRTLFIQSLIYFVCPAVLSL